MSNIKIELKPIKPKQENLPARKVKRLRKNLKNYLIKDAGPRLVREFEKTVVNWKGKPLFVAVYSEPFGTQLQIKVFPKGKNTLKYTRVSEGTPLRTISAKPGSRMVFPLNYDAKTTPAGRYGGSGRRHGPIQRRRTVRHKIEARNFPAKIVKNTEDEIRDDITKIVDRI